jgi:hypothetical protein
MMMINEDDEDNKANETLNNALNELNQAEEDIIRLMEVASETVNELERIPLCDYDKIDDLSKEYLSSLQSIRSKVINHTHLIRSSNPITSSSSSTSSSSISYSINNYALKKEVEISKSYESITND